MLYAPNTRAQEALRGTAPSLKTVRFRTRVGDERVPASLNFSQRASYHFYTHVLASRLAPRASAFQPDAKISTYTERVVDRYVFSLAPSGRTPCSR